MKEVLTIDAKDQRVGLFEPPNAKLKISATGATVMNDLNLEGLSDKQLRLFAVRCARRVQHLMTDPRSIAALDVAERHAKGEATDEELKAASAAADAAGAAGAARAASWAAASAAAEDAAEDAAVAAVRAAADAATDAAWGAWAAWAAARAAERIEQQKILDEIRQEQPR